MIFPRIVCCVLIPALLSSCVTSVYRYVWNRAKVIDNAYWVEDANNVELYRVDSAYYAKGFTGPARGGQTTISKGFPGCIVGVGCGAKKVYNPIQEKAQPAYIRVWDAQHDSTLAFALKNAPKVGNCLQITWDGSTRHLDKLPPRAKKVTQYKVKTFAELHESAHYIPHTDAHGWYAYPLGAYTFMMVDLPLTMLGNIGFLLASIHSGGALIGGFGGFAIGNTVGGAAVIGTGNYYHQSQQQKPDTETMPPPEPQHQR